MESSSVILTFSIFIIVIRGTTGIMNGMEAVKNEFNYQVSILNMCKERHECGGVIIDQFHILTAAHCVHDRSPEILLVAAGMLSLAEPVIIYRRIIAIHIHDGFVANPYIPDDVTERDRHLQYEENDIAVLTVDFPYIWDEEIGRVMLPTINSPTYAIGLFAGWGEFRMGQRLQWMMMEMLNGDECRDLKGYHGIDEFCTMDPTNAAVSSQGDSGGPLVVNGVVVGIYVGGYVNDSLPQIFANVYYHRQFIDKIIHP